VTEVTGSTQQTRRGGVMAGAQCLSMLMSRTSSGM